MENNNTKWEELESKIKDKSETIVDQNNEKEIEGVEKSKYETINRKKTNKKWILSIVIVCIIFIVLLIFSTIFAIINMNNSNIVSGVRIEGIDISGLSRDSAKSKIELLYNSKKDILLKYEDYDATINPELIETNFNIDEAIEQAISVGKNSNIIINNYNILLALIGKKNIDLNILINEEQTKKTIDDIQTNIPGAVIEPDYYIEGDKLVITKGKEGLSIDKEKLINKILDNLHDANALQEYIDIPVFNKKPENIDIEKIYEEVYKEVQDAYYTKEPFTIYPEVEGVDFDLEEAKEILKEDKEQYEIALKITKPQITTAQIGSEAFPELIATFSTRYDASQTDRSTNLRIACEKINDKVVLPGEIFSYNKALGERTAAAGYKNAKVYENGMVVDGIGGGICQISSTLYNAILKANMEATERRNHQFVTSYVEAGRDATVVYGITDFKFKNTRTYAIKIKATASNGVATVSIYGIKEENEYAVSFDVKYLSTIPYTVKYIDDNTLPAGQEKVSQKGANGFITETYIIKSLNGKVVSRTLLSKDTYNAMQRIIVRGTKGTTTNTSKPSTNTSTTQDVQTTTQTSTTPIQENNEKTDIKENSETNNNSTVSTDNAEKDENENTGTSTNTQESENSSTVNSEIINADVQNQE